MRLSLDRARVVVVHAEHRFGCMSEHGASASEKGGAPGDIEPTTRLSVLRRAEHLALVVSIFIRRDARNAGPDITPKRLQRWRKITLGTDLRVSVLLAYSNRPRLV